MGPIAHYYTFSHFSRLGIIPLVKWFATIIYPRLRIKSHFFNPAPSNAEGLYNTRGNATDFVLM